MPLQDVTVRISASTRNGDTFEVHLVEPGIRMYVDKAELRERFADARDRDDLLWTQILLRLDALGLNPRVATPAQLRTAIEAVTYRL